MSESSSSWFSHFGVLSNISSSILQTTSKVTSVVQSAIQQQPNEEQNSGANRNFSSILTDFSSTVLKSAQQLKQVVEETSILGNFTKEHDKFLIEKRTQQRREEAAVPPWVGYKEEEEMKKQILALSQDERNFLHNPLTEVDYHFDMNAVYPVALATLEVDENLKQMRFDLVPKRITEELFWRNYFYRISFIQQSTQLTALANENLNAQSTNETHHERKFFPISVRQTSELEENMSDINQEFVSEDYDTSAINMEDIRRDIEQSSTKKSSDSDESDWVKGLVDELENVSTEELENVSAEEIDAQIYQMLSEENQ